MIVVDASAVLEILLRLPAAEAVERRIFDLGQSLNAPHLIDIEVAHVIRRHAARGGIDAASGRIAILRFLDLPLRRFPHDQLLPRIWDLRHYVSAYDAAYVALAEILEAPLVTRDRRLATASGHRARIELV